jgi:hypothetical protein
MSANELTGKFFSNVDDMISGSRGRKYDPAKTELRVTPERVDMNESAEYFACSRAIGSEHDAPPGELLDRGDSQRVR